MSLALSAGQRSHRAWAETIHAEWTKLRTLASTRWLLLGAAALTVAVSGTSPMSSARPRERRNAFSAWTYSAFFK